MSDKNKQKIARLVQQGWPGANLAVMGEIVAADVVDHGALPGMPEGRDGYFGTLQFFNAVFTNWKVVILHQLADGDMVSTHLQVAFQHTGDGLGVAATGKPVVLEMMLLDRVAEGLVVEEWIVFDQASMMAQISGA
jgi:predicted ester cyclase